jgi:hypothetical protein
MRVITGDYKDSALSVVFKTDPIGTMEMSRKQKREAKEQFKNLLNKAFETLEDMWK